jgi:hypothetical protein
VQDDCTNQTQADEAQNARKTSHCMIGLPMLSAAVFLILVDSIESTEGAKDARPAEKAVQLRGKTRQAN